MRSTIQSSNSTPHCIFIAPFLCVMLRFSYALILAVLVDQKRNNSLLLFQQNPRNVSACSSRSFDDRQVHGTKWMWVPCGRMVRRMLSESAL